MDFRDLVDRHMGFHNQGIVVGHDVHERLARTHDPALGMHLEVHHAPAYRGHDLQAPFCVLERAEALAGLDDVVFKFAEGAGGFFHKAHFHVLDAQMQLGGPLFGLGNGLFEAAPVA